MRRALLATLMTIAPRVFAEDAPPSAPPDAGAKKLEKIEVQAPNAVEERRGSTAAKIVVNHDELIQYGDTTLLEAMKRLPGITVENAGPRGGGSIHMRGLGSGYTQILVDGDPMPPGFSIESISPDLIERIEIYRSATAEFSTQAIAGTINIVLRKPVSQRRREYKAGLSQTNGEVSGNVSAQIADRTGRLAYTLPFYLGFFHFRSTSVSEQLGRDDSGVPNLDYVTVAPGQGQGGNVGLTPKLAWTLGPDETLTWESFLNAGRFHGEFDERSTTFLGTPPHFASDNQAFSSTNEAIRNNFTWNRHLANDARLDLRASVNYNHRESHAILDAFDAADTFFLHRNVDGSASDDGATFKGKYTFPFVEHHAFVSGVEAEYARRRERRVQLDVSPDGAPLFASDESYDARVVRTAAFAQDEWELTARASLYLGLRWEGIDTQSAGNTFDAVSNRSSVWSPILQALWKLPGTEKDQLRAGLARTYKAPSTTDIMPRRFIADNNTPTTPDFQGNPDLKPELAWGLDTAYEHYFARGGLFSVSAYARRVDDVILRELVQVNGVFISRPANLGRADVKGIELDAKFPLAAVVANAPGLDLRANLSRHWSHVEQIPGPDNRLAQQNRWSANAGLDYKLTAYPVTVGTNFTFVSGGPVQLSATQHAYTLPKRSLDAYALWKYSPRIQVRVFANNLLRQDAMRIDRYADTSGSLELTTHTPAYLTAGVNLELKY